ncbi:transporter substrate-binding domain-containing protein [Fulvimarina sp. MAC3]|uniref:transporter substrate-binding domain-containing protein n=1 Tax=Fulvimarina sp. MAC3 TaxID=3148887 RepID=UPI0031FD98C2
MIRQSLIAFTLASAGLAATASHAETLTAGANVGNVPWEFQDESGEIVGFEVELLEEVADRLGYDEVDIQNIPFNGLFSAVQSGRIDVAISSITITDERLQSVSFAQPYYDSDQSLSTGTDSGIKSTADLKGKTVGVDTGSTGDKYATERESEWGLAGISRYEGLNPAMLDLAAGRIDAYVSDIPAVAYYLRDKPEMEVVERLKTGEQYSMMFAKDSELATKASEVLTTLKNEGYIAQLHEKWFGTAPEETTSTVTVMDMPKPKS